MDVLTDNLGLYAEGYVRTILLTLICFAAAMALGTVVAAARVSPIASARAAGAFYVETVRNTPLLLLVLLFTFGTPKVGLLASFFTYAVIAISLYTAAFVSEAIRSGINSVARGQAEAARSIGLTFPQTLTLIVLPQAFRTVVQPIGNVFIALIKNTSLANAASVVELVGAADKVNTDTAQALIAFGFAGLAYLSLTLPAGLVVGAIERKVAIKR